MARPTYPIDNCWYVYHHISRKTGEVFFVGVGNGRKDLIEYSKNPAWRQVRSEHGIRIWTAKEFMNEDQARAMQASEITRLSQAGAPLVN